MASSSSYSSKTFGALLLCACLFGLAQKGFAVRTAPRDAFPTIGSGNKVQVSYYSESLCPGCAQFGSGDLYNAMFKWMPAMDLKLVVYGNAKYDNGSDTYSCQHGPEECYMNAFEDCLLYYANEERLDVWDYYLFFKCADDVVVERYPNVTGISEIMINTCAAKLPPGITAQKLDACAKGPLGQQLIGEARAETDALVPKHTYVPWVTIDDKPIYNNLSNISAEICVAYAQLNPDFNPDLCKLSH